MIRLAGTFEDVVFLSVIFMLVEVTLGEISASLHET